MHEKVNKDRGEDTIDALEGENRSGKAPRLETTTMGTTSGAIVVVPRARDSHVIEPLYFESQLIHPRS